MLENLDFTLFYYIGAIALVMTANTLFGVAKAQKYNEFDWKVLKKGIIKYLLILLGVTFIFGAGTLLPEFKVTLPVIDETVTIVQMLSIMAIAVLIKYIRSCYENFNELMGIKEEIEKTVAEKQKDEFLG